MATILGKDLPIVCFERDDDSVYDSQLDKIKRLAVEIALNECMKGIGIKKIVPVIKGENLFRGQSTSSIASLVDMSMMMKNESPSRLGKQKIAKDFMELEKVLGRIISSYKYQKPQIATDSLRASLKAIDFLEIIKGEVSQLEEIRNALIREENNRLHTAKVTILSGKSITLRDDILKKEYIEENFKLKYYKNEEEQIKLFAEKSSQDIQKKIDVYNSLKKREEICIRNTLDYYNTQCAIFKSRINRMTTKFEEDNSKMNDEIHVKNSNLSYLKQLYNDHARRMDRFKMELAEAEKKDWVTPSVANMTISKSFAAEFTKILVSRVERKRRYSTNVSLNSL